MESIGVRTVPGSDAASTKYWDHCIAATATYQISKVNGKAIGSLDIGTLCIFKSKAIGIQQKPN